MGHNEETADALFDGENYVIEFEEDAPQIPFPIPTYFEAYTTHGWDKPQVTLVGAKNAAEAGHGEFQKAGDSLTVVNGSQSHRFTAYYPWANSVRYTLTDRIPPYTVTVGPDAAFAQRNENYQYATSNATVLIDMDEGDFFPLHVTFEAKDDCGRTTTIEVKDGAGRPLRDTDNNPIKNVTFTKNDRSEVYRVGDYRFAAESNWMDTIRIYLPERTVSVGHGIGANNARLSGEWLNKHPNYQLFDENSDNYTIKLRQTDAFPLEVEFLERSVDNHTRPIKHTFQSATDSWPTTDEFDEPHIFYLQSDYTDTVRYILAYHEDLTDRNGVLWTDGNYDERAVTVVGNADLGANYERFAPFDENGNFRIPLPDSGPYSALPVDVWFALPDANGAYNIDTVYQKVTFNSKDDHVTVSRDDYGNITFTTSGESVQSGDALPPSPAHTFSVYAEWMDEVSYTLPKVPNRDELPTPQEITVGPDAARAAQEAASAREERREPLYATYDEKGEYLIELEEDAFFPYVVNVRYHLPLREARIPDFDEDGELKRDDDGAIVWKWVSATEARIPAFRVNEANGDIEVVRVSSRVRWLNALSEEPTLPDIGADGAFRRNADGTIRYTQPETRPAEQTGQFEFATPGDSVTWNGHIFRAHSARVNPNAAVRASLVLGDGANKRSVIPFRLAGMPDSPDDENIVDETPAPDPTPNSETANDAGDNDVAELLSAQPLTEVQLYANLEGYFNLELDNAHVELYMPDMETGGERLAERFVWGEWNMGNYNNNRKDWNVNPWNRYRESVNYRILTPEGQRETPLKLAQYSTTNAQGRTQYFEIISGSTEQLNVSNIRYVIRAQMKTPNYNDLLKMKVAYVDDRRGGVRITRDAFEYFDENSGHAFSDQPAGLNTNSIDAYTTEYVTTDESGAQVTQTRRVGVYRFTVDETWLDGKLWMTVKRNKDAASYSMFKDLNADIYEGFWFTAEEAQADGTKIDKPLWERELDTQRENDRYASYTDFVNGPKGVRNGPRFTIVWKNGDDPIGIMPFRILVDVDTTNRQENQNPGEAEAVTPVTFSVPRTHNDFIPDENGAYAPSTELERSKEIVDDSGLLIAYYYTQTEGNLFDDRYYVTATYNSAQGRTWAQDGIKVYAGTARYDTLDEAEESAASGATSRAMDVTRQIFSVAGFGADYSENGEYWNGVVFSVFDAQGTLIASKKIVTERREFLTFGRMTSPMGGLYDTDRSDPDYRKGLKSEMEREGRVYSQEVLYSLPDSEYRGIYSGRALYNLPVGYMRDLVPSAPGDYGVKIVAASERFDTYEAAMSSQSLPADLTASSSDDDTADAVAKPLTFNYTASYRNGVYFHLFNEAGTLIDCRYVRAVEPVKSTDTYFEAYGALKRQDAADSAYLSYAMPGNMDTYFSSGYQTVLILNQDGAPVTDRTIYPLFDISESDGLGNQVRIYAGSDKIAGELQNPGKVAQSFSASAQSAIPYSAAATNQKHLKNYWVTFLTQHTGGPKLFVNTANDTSNQGGASLGTRHVFLQAQEDSYQDIFIANIGDEPLRDVTLTLESGESSLLVVDDYWALNGDASARTLAAFTAETIRDAQNGVAPGHGRYEDYLQADIQPANVAKIRVRPKDPTNTDTLSAIHENLIISGTDAAGNRQQSVITLDGSFGEFRITTEALSGEKSVPPDKELTSEGKWVDADTSLYDDYTKDAVKYVSFSRVIQTDWDLSDNGVYFEVTRGRLPDGFPAGYRRDVYQQQLESGLLSEEDFYKLQQIRPNGELFGVPLETGEFTFTVTATFSYTLEGASEPLFTSQDSKEYTLTVLENTDENVENQISDEYGVTSWIPDMNITSEEVLPTETPLGNPGQSRKRRVGVPEVTLAGYQDVKFEFEVEPGVNNIEDHDWVVAVYLNGKLLKGGREDEPGDKSDWDYIRCSGSDVDILFGQTIYENCNAGRNTFDVVARKDGREDSAWTKQSSTNFNVRGGRSGGSGTGGGSSGTGGGSGGGSSTGGGGSSGGGGGSSSGGGGGSSGGGGGSISVTPKYSITVDKTKHGSLSASASRTTAGATVTVTAKPGADYTLDEITVTGKSSKRTIQTSPTRDDNQRTFIMPSEAVTVSATFAQLYAVELASVDFGYVTVNSERNPQGRSVTITAHPEPDYRAKDIRVYANNERLPLTSQGDNTATFRMPANNVYVSATFARVYDVELASVDFGYVTVSSERNTEGDSVTITAHPEPGYKAENLRVYADNALLPVASEGENTATFTMPANNVYVSATFNPINPFKDMSESDWFYADANWAIERGLMNGVRDDTWAPHDNISTATAVVTLARLQMGDQIDVILQEFKKDMFDRPWLPRPPAEGQNTDTSNWYYLEARWAAASGILTENVFTGRDPLSRANFAVILRNYLLYRGITVDVPEPFDFSDADAIRIRGEELREDLNGAFQILRTADVFRGDRTEAMLPNNNSTRAHMAALLHRLTNYIGEYEKRWTQDAEESGA